MIQECKIVYNVRLHSKTFCKYHLKVYDKGILLSFPQLLQLRRKINNLTHPVKISKIIDNENFVLLFVADGKHLLFLEIPELLNLKNEIEYFFN